MQDIKENHQLCFTYQEKKHGGTLSPEKNANPIRQCAM
jgi:hypothetical protein